MKRGKTTEQFITEAKEIHGDKYDYSKVEYINNHTKVCIICPEHGEFWTRPHEHLRGYGCRLCTYDRRRLDNFIEQAKKVHGDRYDYSKIEYKNYHAKITIICPEHGEFKQSPAKHLIGQGCPKCKTKKKELNIK